MDDSVSQAGYRNLGSRPAPSLVSGFTTATSATVSQPRTFCVVCGSFNSELTLRKSGLKCPACIGKKANKHWAKLQKQQATELLQQVTTEENQLRQQQQQTLLGMSSHPVPTPSAATITDSSSVCGTSLAPAQGTRHRSGAGVVGSFECSINPDELDEALSEYANQSQGNCFPPNRGSAASVAKRSSASGAAAPSAEAPTGGIGGEGSHPINDYISRTTVYKAAVHRATLSTQLHEADPPADDGGAHGAGDELGSPAVLSLGTASLPTPTDKTFASTHTDPAASASRRSGPPRLPPRLRPQASTPTPPSTNSGDATGTASSSGTKHRKGMPSPPPPPPAHPPSRHHSSATNRSPNEVSVEVPPRSLRRTTVVSVLPTTTSTTATREASRVGAESTPPPLVSHTRAVGNTTWPSSELVAHDGDCLLSSHQHNANRHAEAEASVSVQPSTSNNGTVANRVEVPLVTTATCADSAPVNIHIRDPSTLPLNGFADLDEAAAGTPPGPDSDVEPPALVNSRQVSEASSVKSLARRQQMRRSGGSSARRGAGHAVSTTGAPTNTPGSVVIHPTSGEGSSLMSSLQSTQQPQQMPLTHSGRRHSSDTLHDNERRIALEGKHDGASYTFPQDSSADEAEYGNDKDKNRYDDVNTEDEPADEDSFGSDSSFLTEDEEGQMPTPAAAQAVPSSPSPTGSPSPQTRKGGSKASSRAASARTGKAKSTARGATTAAASLYPLCVDAIHITVTIPPVTAHHRQTSSIGSACGLQDAATSTAAYPHSRTDSTSSSTSTSSSRPYGYRVQSKTVVGAAAPTASGGGGNTAGKADGKGGSKFTVTRLTHTPATTSRRGTASAGTHARSDSNLSSSSSSRQSTSSTAKRAPERRPSKEFTDGGTKGGQEKPGTQAMADPNNVPGTASAIHADGVEVKKIRYLLHVADATTGAEVLCVERSYFNDIVPALEAVKKLAKRNSGLSGEGAGLPPLPSKRIPSLRMATEAFLEERRAEVEAFVAAVAASPFYIRHPSMVSLLKLSPYLQNKAVTAPTAHSSASSMGAASPSSSGSPSAPGSRRTTVDATPLAAATPFLSDHALNQLRAKEERQQLLGSSSTMLTAGQGPHPRLHRTPSQASSGIHSTRSSVTRRSRLDCVTMEDLEAVQMGNLLGRGTFGSVYLGLIQTVGGPLMIAVKELHLDASATSHEHGGQHLRHAQHTTLTNHTNSTGGSFSPPEQSSALATGATNSSSTGNAHAASSQSLLPGSVEETDEFKKLQSELDILRRTRHKNVVRFLGSLFLRETHTLRVFTEYVECGTIRSLVQKFGSMPLLTIQSYMTQMLAGLGHLHHLGIVHRDIKGENVLVTKNGRVKLSDFGCSSAGDVLVGLDEGSPGEDGSMGSSASHSVGVNLQASMPVGTPLWMAPEVINGTVNSDDELSVSNRNQTLSSGNEAAQNDSPNDALGEENANNGSRGSLRRKTPETCPAHFAADVWALGCVGVEMLDRPLWNYDLDRISAFVILYKIGTAGTPPHGFPTEAELAEMKANVAAGTAPEEALEGFTMYRDFLSKCFIMDPKQRWTVKQLQQHPFLHTPFSRTLRWVPPPTTPPAKKR